MIYLHSRKPKGAHCALDDLPEAAEPTTPVSPLAAMPHISCRQATLISATRFAVPYETVFREGFRGLRIRTRYHRSGWTPAFVAEGTQQYVPSLDGNIDRRFPERPEQLEFSPRRRPGRRFTRQRRGFPFLALDSSHRTVPVSYDDLQAVDTSGSIHIPSGVRSPGTKFHFKGCTIGSDDSLRSSRCLRVLSTIPRK